MGGTAMALPRWARDPWLYRDRVFVGRVLDIGGTGDCIGWYREYLTNITHVTVLDHNRPIPVGIEQWVEGDAGTVPEGQWDCVYSSHCLEHVVNPEAALSAWWQAVAPGGYLVVIVPSWYTYEREVWPPRFNTDHKSAWVMTLQVGHPAHCLGTLDAALDLPGGILVRALTLDEGFKGGKGDMDDQTADGTCESGYEVVVQKARV